jgi:hypothetical protein
VSNITIGFLGGYTGGVTPVPIPNTEVKLSRAHDTMIERSWESRTLPGIFLNPSSIIDDGFFLRRKDIIISEWLYFIKIILLRIFQLIIESNADQDALPRRLDDRHEYI